MSIWHGLPPDLFNPIISVLHDDIPSSRNCALVCGAWVAPSRRNIFHTVRLVFRLGHCESLLALLERTPAIASCIREVKLVVRHMVDEWDRPALRTLLVCLDKLTTVKLAVSAVPLDLLEEHPSLERITALHLGGIFPSTIAFHQFVAAFPSLSELGINRLEWRSNSWDNIPYIKAPPLRILRLRPAGIDQASILMDAVIRWLVEQRSPVPLQELVFSLHTGLPDMAPLQELLRKSGSSLRSVVLYGDIKCGHLNLEHCTSLASLRIASDELRPVIDTLSTVQSVHMRSLELDVDDAVVEPTSEWDKLAAMLNQPLFDRLDKLTLRVQPQTDGLRSRFRLLQQRGVLRWYY